MRHLKLLFLFLLISESIFAVKPKLGIHNYLQPSHRFADDEGANFWDRVSFGGNVGLQFGNPTNILLSPAVGYTPKANYLNNRLMMGLGITYMYSRVKYIGENYQSNIYGGRTFLRFLITENVFAYTEYELLNSPNYLVDNNKRAWVNSFFVGGGYLLRFSGRGGITIMALYNLAWTPTNLVYASPWNIRIGFMF